MPARTGNEYIERLREQGPDVYLHGERVKDVTAHPALRNGVNLIFENILVLLRRRLLAFAFKSQLFASAGVYSKAVRDRL